MDYGSICSASSEESSLKITWKIPDYLTVRDTCHFPLDSSQFIFANATWCLRFHPDKMSVSLRILHSLMRRLKITCMFGVLKQNGECFKDEQEYRPLKFYDADPEDESYDIGEEINRSGLVSGQNVLTPDGTLVLMGHLLFEEITKNEYLKEGCASDNRTNYYKKEEMEKNSSTLSLTYSKVKSIKVTWKVPEYSSILENALGYSLSSPLFDFGYATWFLKLYPVGVEENESGTGLSIVRSNSLVPLFHEIIYTWDVITEGVEPFSYNFYNNYRYKKLSFNEESEMKESRQHFFDTRTILVDCLAQDDDGNVTFLIHIFYDEAPVKDAAVQKMTDELNMYRTFGRDLKNFLMNGSGHDLILKVKEREFRVHRQILSSRSPVFESMLTHDMTEKNCGVVNIPDCDPPVIEQFLLYVYSGKMDSLDETNMLGLYYVADKYDMMHLKEICRGFIRKSLCPRNVCVIVQLAVKHSDEDLVEFAIEFFKKNKNEILTTTEWVSFMKGSEGIANEILRKVSGEAAGQKRKMEDQEQAATNKKQALEEDNL